MRVAMRPQPTLWAIMVMAALALITGCHASSPFVENPFTPRDGSAIQVQVANHSYWNLRVFLERGGVEFPLGKVERMETVTFELGEGLLAGATHYSLVTKPTGAGTGFQTERVAVVPGRLHRWTLLPSTALFHGVER